jgi:hypothetical protein
MAEELGVVFDTIRDVIGTASDVLSTLNTVQDVCDGTCVALGAASVIPGAAAFTGPVITVYQSMRPTLVTVIDVGGAVVQFMGIAMDVLDAADAAISGDFEKFASEAAGLASQAFADGSV